MASRQVLTTVSLFLRALVFMILIGTGMTTGSSGIPCSLTLGGYDENRFVPHDVEFSLADNGNTPRVLVRGLSVSTAQDGRAPVGWSSTTRMLSNMSTSFEALIDSSTPFLWLPDAVCDEFAQALGLIYNDTFALYIINNTQFDELLGATFSFTFSLSSFDNTDDFGDPLSVPGVVNITITSAAFAQILRYPFQDGAIGYGDPSVPYFPLRRTGSSNSTFIIGRSFLQEAYIITKYDSGVFSVHQAQSPEDPLTDLAIKRIDRPDNSPFPPPAGHRGDGLSTGQIVGIALGAGAIAIIAGLVTWLCCRRRKASKAPADQEKTGSLSSLRAEEPQTPIARLFSRIVRRRRSRNAQIHEAPGSASQPTEVGAEAGHAVYELPAPLGPMELDASHDDDSFNDDTLRTDDSQTITAYEAARRKLAKQLQGPVPPYSPPDDPANQPYPEKTMRDISPVVSHHATDNHPSAVSSPTTTCGNSNSFPGSLPSPLSQRGDGAMRIPDLPSPITAHDSSPTATNKSADDEEGSLHGNQSLQAPTNVSNPSNQSSSAQSDLTPSPVTMSARVQRTPIDASRVVYLGPLPENPSTYSRGLDSDGSQVPRSDDPGRVSCGTLGSNYTEMESQHLEGNTEQPHSSEQPPNEEGDHSTELRQEEASNPGSGASQRQGRVGSGSEFIHVPQLADRRYSWEDDR